MDSSSLATILESAEVQAFATGFPTALAHLGVTLALLAAGAVIYALFTPWKEISLIREGNAAAAVAFSGVLIGLAIPLAVSLSVSTSIKDIVLWGMATVMLQLLAFRLVDLLLTGLPQRIREGEIAAAVLLVGAKISTALILAAALTG
jgi:putative membrane protein